MKGWSVMKNVRAFHEYSQELRRRHSGSLHWSCGAYGASQSKGESERIFQGVKKFLENFPEQTFFINRYFLHRNCSRIRKGGPAYSEKTSDQRRIERNENPLRYLF